MKSLFRREDIEELISRIDQLEPRSQRLWGKMDVAQMMAHCSGALDMACGRLNPPRTLIGRLMGPFVRPIYTNEKPFSKGGDAQCTRHPHPFFGALSPQDWSRGMYKHMDHHLRQFGV
jgi:hypothetical protein